MPRYCFLIFIAFMPSRILLHQISGPWPGSHTGCMAFLRVPIDRFPGDKAGQSGSRGSSPLFSLDTARQLSSPWFRMPGRQSS